MFNLCFICLAHILYSIFAYFRKKQGVSAHKQSLEKLKEKDPEFYKFLQSEDKELLQFDDSGSDDDDEDESSDESDSGKI